MNEIKPLGQNNSERYQNEIDRQEELEIDESYNSPNHFFAKQNIRIV